MQKTSFPTHEDLQSSYFLYVIISFQKGFSEDFP